MTFGTDSSFVFCFRDAVSKTVSKKLFPKCSFQKLFLNVVSERYFKNAISKTLFQKRYFRNAVSETLSPKINPRKINLPKINLRSRRRVCFP